jgi:hypothetical protein
MDIKTKNGIEVENQYREWIAEISLNIIRKALGNTTHRLYFEKYPAIGKIAVSSPAVMKSLNFYNEGKPYSQQIKPFNFLLTCNVRELGHPIGSDPDALKALKLHPPSGRNDFTSIDFELQDDSTNSVKVLSFHGCSNFRFVMDFDVLANNWPFNTESSAAKTDVTRMRKFVKVQMAY